LRLGREWLWRLTTLLASLMAVTWRRNGGVQGSRQGAVEAVGGWWVGLATCCVVLEGLVAVLKQGVEC
jgi:hypothetical protein